MGGVWCWELDSIEANAHAMQVAPHVCSDPPGRHVAQCDPGGAASNSFLADQEGLCPNDGCIIDTRRPFRHHQTFVADGATLVAIENRLEQGGREFAFNGTSDRAYLARMSGALRHGMVLVVQLWGGPRLLMSWLDAMTNCVGDCPSTSQVVFSDIVITPV